jgi:hypothetical protein
MKIGLIDSGCRHEKLGDFWGQKTLIEARNFKNLFCVEVVVFGPYYYYYYSFSPYSILSLI